MSTTPHSINLDDGGMVLHKAPFTLLSPPKQRTAMVFLSSILSTRWPLCHQPPSLPPTSLDPKELGAVSHSVSLRVPSSGLTLTPQPAWRVFLEFLVLGG